ncbi:MAG: hypothetical protein MUF42_02810 [Cytophagaceae bacterium]|jgi:signal transduction histidine kinase|nr:hypothetical protein [Cytophagaceae bacterium]
MGPLEVRTAKLVQRTSKILIFLSILAVIHTILFEDFTTILRLSLNLVCMLVAYGLSRSNHLVLAKIILCLSPGVFSLLLPTLWGDVPEVHFFWFPLAAVAYSIFPYLFFDYVRERKLFFALVLFHLFLAIFIPVKMNSGKVLSETNLKILGSVSFITAYTIMYLLINLCVLALVSINKFYESHIEALNDSLEKTVSQRTSELMERNIQLNQYAYMNSHKVRGPLARIMGLLELLKEEKNPEEQKNIQHKLLEAAREMDVVVGEMNKKLNE